MTRVILGATAVAMTIVGGSSPWSEALGAGDDRVLFHGLRGTYAIGGGDGHDVLTTVDCSPYEHVGHTVSCGRSTATVTSIERYRHRSGRAR